jgi:hypothetical protein
LSSMMEDTILGNGKTTKCTVTGNYITKMVKLRTKVIGKVINFVVKVVCSTIVLRNFWDHLTTMILQI